MLKTSFLASAVLLLPVLSGCIVDSQCDLDEVFAYSITVGNHTSRAQSTGFTITTDDSNCVVFASGSSLQPREVESFLAKALPESMRLEIFADDGSKNLTLDTTFHPEDTIGLSYAIFNDRIEASTVVE